MSLSGDLVSSGNRSVRGLHQSAQAGAKGGLGSFGEREKGEEEARCGASVESAGMEQLDWRSFTPSEIDPSKCMARTWNFGKGGQCTKSKLAGERFCKGCARRLVHGAVDGPIPEKKLIEFQKEAKKCAKKRGRESGVLHVGGGAGGSGSRVVGGLDSIASTKEPGGEARGTLSGGVSNASFTAVPRRTEIGDMKDILAENQYVEREMERRNFQRRDGQWVGGVLLPEDPLDDAELESSLRSLFRTQQAEGRSRAWGPGRTLGRS